MNLSLESDVFKAKAKVLDELNRHHMDEEEKEHFPWLERNCSADQLEELFDQYERAEEKEQ
jgi:hemerythrin-like domain-containing protein